MADRPVGVLWEAPFVSPLPLDEGHPGMACCLPNPPPKAKAHHQQLLPRTAPSPMSPSGVTIALACPPPSVSPALPVCSFVFAFSPEGWSTHIVKAPPIRSFPVAGVLQWLCCWVWHGPHGCPPRQTERSTILPRRLPERRSGWNSAANNLCGVVVSVFQGKRQSCADCIC